jgi:hypothetical protein
LCVFFDAPLQPFILLGSLIAVQDSFKAKFFLLALSLEPVEYVVHQELHYQKWNNRQRMDQLLRTFEFFERWTDKSKETSHQLLAYYNLSDDGENYTLP